MSKGNDTPQFFRLNEEVGNLEQAVDFYTNLLGVSGRRQPGARCYFDCGPVTLSILDVSSVRPPQPAVKALYFTVKDLDAAFERAKALDCLSAESVHDGSRRRHRGSAVGRAILLCARSVGQSALFCGGGDGLRGVSPLLLRRISESGHAVAYAEGRKYVAPDE